MLLPILVDPTLNKCPQVLCTQSTDETHKKIKNLKKISKNKIIYLKHKINFGLNIALLNGFKKIMFGVCL